MNLRRWLMYGIPIMILIIVLFLLFFKTSSTPEIYDFLENFKSASRSGFSESALKICLPNFYYDKIPEEIKSIISNKKFSAIANELTFTDRGIIRLALKAPSTKTNTYEIKFIYGNKKNYLGIQITAGVESEIEIFELAGQKKREISGFSIDFDVDKANSLYLILNNDYLLLLGEDCYYRVIKDKCFLNLKNGGSFIYSGSAQPEMRAEFSDLQKSDRQILYKYNEDFRQEYLEGNAPFNDLSPLDDTLNPNLNSPFIKRFKSNEGITTNAVIYMPAGSSMLYKKIPLDDEYKFYARLSFAGRSKIKELGFYPKFKILIRDDEGNILKSYVITYKFPQSFWKEININLKQFKGEKVNIEFAFPIPSEMKKEGYNSVAIVGGPCLVPVKKNEEPNIILIVLDTLRSDHLGCYGYFLPTSPNIDKFSRESILIDNHIAAAPNTIMSHRSLFTGLYPSESGFNLLEKTIVDRSFVPFLHSFSPKIVTMADYLKSNNYYTAAFTGGLYMSQNQGFDKGFHEFSANKRIKLDMNVELRRVTRWINQHKDVKFFLFFHTYEIHSPYTRDYFKKRIDKYPKELDRKEVISRYDSGIRYADQNIGELIKILKEQSLYDDTIIIITSDHGERFDLTPEELKLHPHVGIHGHSLYDCEIKIPLIIGGWSELPRGIRIDKQTRNIDVLPTLLDILDIHKKETISGQSLKKYFEDDSGTDRLAYSETVKMLGNPTKIMYSLRSGDNKVIKNYNLADPEKKNASHSVEWEFYDLKKDPLEKNNIVTENGTFKQQMKILEMLIAKCSEGYKKYKEKSAKASFDRQKLIDLQRLGYIN